MTVDLATRRHGSPEPPGTAGSPVPLVLLHAFPLHAAMWDDLLDSLAGPVLVVDLPGLGNSPVPDGEPDLAVSADAVVAAMDGEGIGRAVIAGVSMGGYVAMAIARRHPARLAGIGLIDTKASADGEEARTNRERIARAVTGDAGTGRLGRWRLLVILGWLVALGPLSTDAYVPGLPDLPILGGLLNGLVGGADPRAAAPSPSALYGGQP